MRPGQLQLGASHLALAPLLLSLALVTGCGWKQGEDTSFTPVAGTESAYCDAYRAWQVHELDGGEGDDQTNPGAFRRYWNEYVIFEETLLHEAPPEIRGEVTAKVSGIRTLITPLLEKYEFDADRLLREGTAAERALFEAPPPEIKKAQDAQHAYEDRVCGVASPPAADVVFEHNAMSKDYCAALSKLNGRFEKAELSRFDPDVVRRLFTADGFTDSLDAVEEAAPGRIAADVEAESEWLRTRWSEVFAEFGYDIRRIWVEATPEDRAAFTLSHPDVVEHASRTTAYEEQVCDGVARGGSGT
jgi:hypothetical protein